MSGVLKKAFCLLAQSFAREAQVAGQRDITAKIPGIITEYFLY